MGYYMSQRSCENFLLKKRNFKKALEAIKQLAGKGTYPGSTGRHYSWVSDSEYINAKTLKEAVRAWRWRIELDDKGNAIELDFEGEKLGDDEVFLKAIAPYVESGEIEMTGDDNAQWKWVFRAGTLVEYTGHVVYE